MVRRQVSFAEGRTTIGRVQGAVAQATPTTTLSHIGPLTGVPARGPGVHG